MSPSELVPRPAERGAEWGKTPPRSEEHAFLAGPRNRPLELLWVLRTAPSSSAASGSSTSWVRA